MPLVLERNSQYRFTGKTEHLIVMSRKNYCLYLPTGMKRLTVYKGAIMKTEMPVVPIQTGEVFLQDKIVDETHCYICKKEFNKFDDKDMLLMRINGHEMGFVCPDHRGVCAEFMRKFKIIPGGWEVHAKKDDDVDVIDCINAAGPNELSSKPHEKT